MDKWKFIKKLFFYVNISLVCSHFYTSFAANEVYEKFEMDLNKDELLEKIVLSKKYGLDLIQIFSSKEELFFEHEVTPMGKNSKVTKISQAEIDSTHQCLLVYYFQGKTGVYSPKKSSRLLSFCFNIANIKKMEVQDLGYTSWDYLTVVSYLKLEGQVNIKKYKFYGKEKILLTLSSGERNRAWEFDIKENKWLKLPEYKFAQFQVVPSR